MEKKDVFTNTLKKLDYKLCNYEDRLKLVKELFGIKDFNGKDFPNDFWIDLLENTNDGNVDTSSYKACLNKEDMLYSDTDVCQLLESIGTYLLNAPDIKESNTDDIKIYHSKELFDRALQEERLRNSLLTSKDDDMEFSVFVKQRNYRLAKDTVIDKKQLNKHSELKDYQRFLESTRDKLRVLNEKKRNGTLTDVDVRNLHLYKKVIASVKSDLNLAYESIVRPIRFINPLKDTGCPDWNSVDMSMPEVIKVLLTMWVWEARDDDLNTILLDLDILLKEMNLNDEQKELLKMYRAGANLSDIAAYYKVNKSTITRRIDNLAKKISDAYMDKYSDWYYFNVCKGEYKTCPVCGKAQLASKIYKIKSNYAEECCCDCIEKDILFTKINCKNYE